MIPTATEIATWANKRDAQSLLPILLRRLIHGSISSIRAINFPGGDSVQLGGFDGTLDVEQGNSWIPDGKSVWESSCNRRVRGKADSDYKKRTAKTRRKERLESTFAFVTARRWTKKEKWAKGKNSEGKWKEVRCFDADDLEQWLELNPHAATWLAERIPTPSVGFITDSQFWDWWANACDPALPVGLVLAGRDDAARALRDTLRAPPARPITISADSRDEALAFVCAALRSDLDKSFADRLLIATGTAPIENLQGMVNLTLAIDSESLEARTGSLASQIHLIVPRARGEINEDAQIALGTIRGDIFDKCLEQMELPEGKRTLAARESGRSLPILRRRWAKLPALRQPAWSGDSDTARKLVPFALCGNWNMQSGGDLNVLAGIANKDRSTIEREIADLIALNDSPIEAIGTVNRVVSQIDALFAVGMRITRTDIERFFHFAEETFGTRDPALDLPPEKRWMANVIGKEHPFSGNLRRGLGNTLVPNQARFEHDRGCCSFSQSLAIFPALIFAH